MNMVKVYNRDGVWVDKFKKQQSKHEWFGKAGVTPQPTKNYLVKFLNSKGFYVRSQLGRVVK